MGGEIGSEVLREHGDNGYDGGRDERVFEQRTDRCISGSRPLNLWSSQG